MSNDPVDPNPDPPQSSLCATSDEVRAALLDSLLRSLPGYVWIKSVDGTYLACNEALDRAFGGDSGVLGRRDLELFPPATAALFEANDRAALASPAPVLCEEEVVLPGETEPTVFETLKGPLRARDGRLFGIFGAARIVTASRTAEDRLALLDRVLAKIAAGEPLRTILHELARVVEEQSPGSRAALFLLDDSGERLIPAAAPGLAPDAVAIGNRLRVAEGSASSGTAAFRREPVFVTDVETDPLWADFREEAAARGVKACWSLPVLDRNRRVLGVLTLYADRCGEPRPRQRQLYDLATRLAALAITRSREEGALRQSEALSRMVLDSSADLLWLYDLAAQRFTWVSPSVEKARGFTVQEVLSQSLADTVPPELVPWLREGLAEAIADFESRGEAARTITTELQQLRKDGSQVPAEVVTTFVTDANGRVTHLQGVTRDITERRQAEEARAEAAAFREALFEAFKDGIAVIDQEHRVRHANRRFAEMLGYSAEEVLTLHTWDWEATMSEADIRAGFADLSQIHLTFETRHRRKDGSIYDVEVSASGIRVGGENVILTISRDISERKQAEAARHRLEAELAAAQKLESVGRLAGGVAHDFNNLLSLIRGHAELALARAQAGDPLRRHLAEIERAAERSAQLTRQLLSFARRQPIEPRRIDLRTAVETLFPVLQRLVGEQVELRLESTPSPCVVRIDPSQIDQLLTNLCANARDSISGPGQVVLRTAALDLDEEQCARRGLARPASFVRLSVADNGSGIDRETLDHIFEPFFTTKQVGRGTGLGLASVYGIVQQNGGFVEVESRPGEGSVFHLDFPRQEGEPEPVFATLPEPAPRARSGETILVVEDEVALLQMASSILEGLGYRVIAASSPLDALALAEAAADRIDLLLTDIVMPGMNGRQLARRLRELRPTCPCLFMSGYAPSEHLEPGEAADSLPLLAKPFTPHELAVRVRAALPPTPRAEAPVSPLSRILFVDDEESLGFLLGRVLARLGYRLTPFSAPAAALAAFRANPDEFDVVITDLSMPGFSGLELLAALRAVRPALPAIVVSGFVSEAEREQVRAAGARALVLKGSSVEELGRDIDRALREG